MFVYIDIYMSTAYYTISMYTVYTIYQYMFVNIYMCVYNMCSGIHTDRKNYVCFEIRSNCYIPI